MTLRLLTAGESHGPDLLAILEGFWSNVPIDEELINHELKRRQSGYGRGGRMKIEKDRVEFISGVRHGKTLGSPISLNIKNQDYNNWQKQMSPRPLDDGANKTNGQDENQSENDSKIVTRPRPGHADLPGALKYHHSDIRNVLERSSARETAVRTAVGALCRQLLDELGINIYSHVVGIGDVLLSDEVKASILGELNELKSISKAADESSVRCLDPKTTNKMTLAIDDAKLKGDSLGGIFEVIITGVPIGLGSHVHFDRKFDGLLSGAMMSLQGIKGVEIGLGFEAAKIPGSKVHDEIFYHESRGFYRNQNNAGGIEGGITNGEPLVIRCAMKPIPTLTKPLSSVDYHTKKPFEAQIERSDVCAVPAASIVAENIASYEILKVIKAKFGGDSKEELVANYESYISYLKGE